MGNAYDAAFYASQADASERSARSVAPLVLERLPATSLIDVGCGVGAWVKVYSDLGVADARGLDGDWALKAGLRIPEERFTPTDLAAPPRFDRRFDIAQSLEVAEHLDADVAERFVGFLCSLADIVIFSAAVPRQGGTHHVNEQWPSYWATLFQDRGYALFDVFRPRLWDDEDVEWWYRQNMFLYARASAAERVGEAFAAAPGFVLPERLMHPGWAASFFENGLTLRFLLGALPEAARRAVLRRIPGGVRGETVGAAREVRLNRAHGDDRSHGQDQDPGARPRV